MTTPLAVLNDLKTYLSKPLTSSPDDTLLTLVLGYSMTAMNSYLNRNLAYSAYSELRDGNGNQKMQVVGYPILTFTSLVITQECGWEWGPITIPPSTNSQAGYLISGRSVILRGYKFSRGNRNVAMSYTGGYGDAMGPSGSDVNPWPQDLKMAVLMIATQRFREISRLGSNSRMIGTESVTYDNANSGIPAGALTILSNYRNVVPETGG